MAKSNTPDIPIYDEIQNAGSLLMTCSVCHIERDHSCFYKRDRGGLRRDCKICRSQKMAEYRNKNKDTINDKKKIYYAKNRDKVKSKVNEYYINNKSLIFAKYREKYQNNTLYALKLGLRNRLNIAIKKEYRSGSAVRDLGCTIEELKLHLESLFQPGMTWENWTTDGWHIDHVVPLAAFDLSDPEQLRQACHYTNLQPLWATDNIRKSNNVQV